VVESRQLESLKRAVQIYGSQSATARGLGVSQAAVWKWCHGKVALPPQHVLAVEAATGVSKHDLRPDIYPLDNVPKPAGTARFEHAS
jgi:DNA-binding transcriptional regulator YdaS (Cro superfamily)